MAFNSADIGAFKNVWVFCEQRQGVMMPTTFELISEGRKLANELGVELCGILLGDNVDGIAAELGEYGADKVYVYNSPLPKDFTTARPRAYSRMAPVISRLACASTGAFCALYREMSSRKPSDTAAASKAMSAVRGLNTNRLRNTTAPAVKGKPL